MFLAKVGLGEEWEQPPELSAEELEAAKERAEQVASVAVTGYLEAKKKREERIEAQRIADQHKRKGPVPEAVREHLRAIHQDLSQQAAGGSGPQGRRGPGEEDL